MNFSGNSKQAWKLPTLKINTLRRNEALQETDWTQTLDAPLSAADQKKYQQYRQALRDLPTHSKWPDLDESDWPTLE